MFPLQRWRAETARSRCWPSVTPVWLTLSWTLWTPAATTSFKWSHAHKLEKGLPSHAGAPPCWTEVKPHPLSYRTLLSNASICYCSPFVPMLFITHSFSFPSPKPLPRLCLPPVPPSNVTVVPSNTSLNLSWVPGERDRNHGFRINYLRKSRKTGRREERAGSSLWLTQEKQSRNAERGIM